MASPATKSSEESSSEDLPDDESVNRGKPEGRESAGSVKSENQRRFEEEMAAFELTKPW